MPSAEEWRAVVGYEGVYSVSNLGRVRRDATAPGAVAGAILRPRPTHKGYVRVALHNNYRADLDIHRLVAEAFIGPRPTPAHQCNHRDGNKTNNCVSNLAWRQPFENMRHAFVAGLHTYPSASNPHARLTESMVRAIRNASPLTTNAALAVQYGVSASAIGHARAHRTWRALAPTDEREIERVLRGDG